MAEQEACAELVEKASEECEKKDSESIQGESLLLPLLQGLLDAPETEQTADSGTESGEDLRNGLILEVQNALDKLSASLKSDSSDVSSERRNSLLQLISRLQTGLSTQLSPSSSSERRASLQTRFGKRKQRANRHTVGVTTEELEDARRLMQEIALRDNLLTTCTAMPPECGPLQKQHSEGSILQTQPFKQLKHQKIKPVKNLTAKPFISSTNTSQSQSGTSSTVDTPTETSESLDFLTSSPEKSQTDIPQHEPPQVVLRDKKPQYAQYHQSMSFEPEKPPITQRRPLSEAVSLDFSREIDLKSVQKAVTQAAAIKQLNQLKSDVSEDTQDSETDDDPVTVKVISHQPEIIDKPQIQDVSVVHDPPVQPQPDLLLQTNPVYQQPDNSDTENDDCSSQYNEKANRFNSKKLKMKRANTIDIPKPLKYYECDDAESEDEHDLNARRNSYLALRGPISIGKFNTGKKVPEFQPKTDSDHKFVAFLNKHNENTDPSSKASIWAKQQKKHSNNWTNKFGNIKTTFEKIGDEKSSSVSSARDFWKSADDAMSAGKVAHIGPKISRQSARNLQQMFEEKQKQTQQTTPWSKSNNINIVTGSLKVDTKAFEGNKNMKVVTQPNSVNKFSHAPISAFKPVPKKADLPFNHVQNQRQNTQDTENRPIKIHNLNIPSNTHNVADKEDTTESSDSPLFLYSPKPLSPENVVTSPVLNSAPWGNRGGESRVLSIAASKFQNKVAPEQNRVSQRRPSKEKISIPSALQHVPQPEKLTAPYLVKSLGQGNSVKKLSGHYDNIEAKNSSIYSQPPLFMHYNQTPQTQRPLSNQFLQNQNYTIYYRQSQNNPPYNNELSKAHPFSAQSNMQHFVPQTYQNHGAYSDRNDLGRAQANTFEADVAVHQRQYNQCQNVSQQRYSQPQIYQSHFTEQHENSEPQYTSSCQFKPQRSIQPKYVSNTNQFYTPHEQHVEVPSQPHVSHHQQQRLPEMYQSTQTEYPPSQQFTSHPELAYSDKLPKQPSESHESVNSERVDLQQKQTPSEPLTIFDYPSPPLSPQNRSKYEKQTSQESVTEYTAVSSKIMSGPVSQQAVTVQQNSPKNRNQHDMDAALNLKTSLEKISKVEQRSSSERKHSLSGQSFKIKAPIEKSKENNAPAGGHIVYNNVNRCPRSQNKPAPPDFYVNDKPVSLESFEINERGQSVLTSKFHIPVKTADQDITPGQVLRRSESWHQICRGGSLQTNKPSPKASPNSKFVSRSKSSHTLALPKQFEAGMTKSEMSEKKRSIEAYFGETGKIEPKKSSINRVKTSQKISTQRQNSGLCRSRTLPDIVCLDKLDDNNIDEVFEDLFQSST